MGEFIAMKPTWLKTVEQPHRLQDAGARGGAALRNQRPDRNNDDRVYLQVWDRGSRLQSSEN